MILSARLSAVLIAAFALVMASSEAAFAGSYQVTACKAAAGNLNSAWTYAETGAAGKLEHGDGCAGSGEFGGLWVRDQLGSGLSSNGDVSGFWRFDAPATTTIIDLSYSRYLRTFADDRFRSEARTATGTVLEGCQLDLSSNTCTLGSSGGAQTSFGPISTTRLEVGVRCASGSTSMFCINGSGIHRAQSTLYGATVTVSDPEAPSTGALTGSLFSGGWIRGTRSAAMTASDATGIASLELTRDGGASVRTTSRTCDYRLTTPCTAQGGTTNGASAWSDVDTASLPDGAHTFTGVARDAAQNPGSTASRQVLTDNTPSVPPVGLTAGVLWSNVAARNVSWALPGGQAAPITIAQVQICKSGGGCFTPSASATSAAFSLPDADALYTAAVKLVDDAGNVGEAGSVQLGYDTSAPPAPQLGAVESVGGDGYAVSVDASNDPGPAPVTGLQGEACPVDGGACQPIMGDGTTRASFLLPSVGTWTIAVRSIDAAANVGSSATTIYTVTVPPPVETPTAAAPTTTPMPTAAPTPVVRRTPQLKLTRARLTKRRVSVRGVVSRPATGKVQVRIRARKRTIRKTVIVRGGRFAVTVRLAKRQRGARSARVRVSYGGDGNYAPRARTVRVKR